MSIRFFAFLIGLFIIICGSNQVHALYFGHDIKIASSDSGLALIKGQVASTMNGDVYATWVDQGNIYFISSQQNGTKFSTPVVLSNNNSNSSSPQIAAAEKGSVYVMWVDRNSTAGDSNLVFKSSNDYGKNFAHSFVLNKSPSLNESSISSAPQIAATEKGSVYVVWTDNTLQFKEIVKNGSIFGIAVPLSNNLMHPLSPQVLATGDGDVYIIWVDKNSHISDTSDTNDDSVLLFKKASETFFDRNL